MNMTWGLSISGCGDVGLVTKMWRHSGRPHGHIVLATSWSNILEWWVGRCLSPWDLEADAMRREVFVSIFSIFGAESSFLPGRGLPLQIIEQKRTKNWLSPPNLNLPGQLDRTMCGKKENSKLFESYISKYVTNQYIQCVRLLKRPHYVEVYQIILRGPFIKTRTRQVCGGTELLLFMEQSRD